jgi:hypothetical protein
LDAVVVLGMVEKEALAALVGGMPFKNVELWLLGGGILARGTARRTAVGPRKLSASCLEGRISRGKIGGEAREARHVGDCDDCRFEGVSNVEDRVDWSGLAAHLNYGSGYRV